MNKSFQISSDIEQGQCSHGGPILLKEFKVAEDPKDQKEPVENSKSKRDALATDKKSAVIS